MRLQPRRQLCRRPIAGHVTIIGDQHPRDAGRLKGPQMGLGEALDAVARGDVMVTRMVEGQRIEQRLAQHHLALTGQAFGIPHSPVRPRQVEVQGRALAQIGRHLAPVDLADVALTIAHRHHQRAGKMLVARGAQEAQALQRAPQRRPRLAGLLRQAVAERTVGEAEPEARDQRPIAEPPLLQVGERLGALHERLVVEGDHLVEQRLVVPIGAERPIELHRPCALGRWRTRCG